MPTDERNDTPSIRFKAVQPILPVKDVLASAQYWEQRLGFTLLWVSGEPPEHAGLCRDTVCIRLQQNNAVTATAEGHEFLFGVRNVQDLYAEHLKAGVEVLAPLQLMSWGSEDYVVRELNGYHLRFSGAPARPAVSKTMPTSIRIVERALTVAEYLRLTSAVGWTGISEATALSSLEEACCSLVAEQEDGLAVAGLLLTPFKASDYHLKDVMVHPDWQGQRVGSALMQNLMSWLNENAPGTIVTLGTDEGTARFYEAFGFAGHFGMSQRVPGEVPPDDVPNR